MYEVTGAPAQSGRRTVVVFLVSIDTPFRLSQGGRSDCMIIPPQKKKNTHTHKNALHYY